MSGSWDGGWVLKYLFSYLHPFLCKDPRDGPTLSCVGGQSFTCLIMSSVTPQAQPPTAQIPAFLSVDPRNYTRSPHGLGPMTSYLWVSVHSLPRQEFVRALEKGYSLKWEEEGMLRSMAGKPVVKTFRNQNAAGSSSEKVAKERWLRKRAHVSPMEKIPDKHCLIPLGLPSVSFPPAAGLGYKCYTPQTSAHLLQVEAHGYPQNCI